MTSLRTRLLMGTILGSAVVLVAAGMVVYTLVRGALVAQMDQALTDEARLLTAGVEQEGRSLDQEFDEFDMKPFQRPRGPAYLQVWREDGDVLYRSRSLGQGNLPRSDAALETPVHCWLDLPHGLKGRGVEVTFVARERDEDDEDDEDDDDGDDDDDRGRERRRGRRRGEPQRVSLVLARDATKLLGTLADLRVILLAVGAVAMAISAAILWLVVGRGLAPVDKIAGRIGALREENLAEGLEATEAPKELQPIVSRLNGLLGRLERAFRRERSFSADVAHELRTPLAALRATMEVALSKQRTPAEYEEAIADSLDIALQLQAMVENLLCLARLEANQAEANPAPLRLDKLAQKLWEPFGAEAESRRLQVTCEFQPARARTDPTLVELVVRNLLANAATYADDGGTVEIASGSDANEGTVFLRVANSGSGIASDQAEQVFERFWRGDVARTAAGVHCGLGLSLVQRAMTVLGGTVNVETEAGGWFRISASLPGA